MAQYKRLGGIMAITLATATGLTACGFGGSSGEESGGGTTLDLLVPSYSDATQGLWNDVIAGFEEENPDIDVNLQVESWDNLESVIATKIQGGDAPDIYNGGPFAGFAEDELLYPAEEVVSEDTLADFQPTFLENAQVGDTVYGLPFIASARALFVNDALLEEAGADVPTTWDELLESAKKVSELGGGVAGYGMPLGSEEAQAEAAVWLWGGGGSFGDADAITVDAPENLPGAEFIKTMIDEGATQADAGATDRSPLMDIFVQGKIGMQVGLPPTVGQIESDNPDLEYSVHPIPTEDGSPFTLGVADHLMAFQNDGDKQEAITAFLDYFYSPEVYVPWVQAEGFLPTTLSGSEELADEEALAPFLEVLPDAQFYPTTNPDWQATDSAFKALFGQLDSDKSAEDVLADIQAQVDAG
ncbi:extracellular solute-binding protein [Promicromonospora citrea]|uniref:Solute-binding protein n=1 Tax=Promicromonospora citrea TaxID=43677 RepID=A0A8H9GD86_9MICO|nr:extracellular solute-binding protein [Promicromonospora citrea]NNH50685.1 extracellular solute-binding protein [Promicromonospora citrea]GGM11512.1 solute-binding protein [Promicromonospora citrea]